MSRHPGHIDWVASVTVVLEEALDRIRPECDPSGSNLIAVSSQ